MGIDKQLLKGTIPRLVLHLLAQADLYGYQLIKSIVQASGGVFKFSAGSPLRDRGFGGAKGSCLSAA